MLLILHFQLHCILPLIFGIKICVCSSKLQCHPRMLLPTPEHKIREDDLKHNTTNKKLSSENLHVGVKSSLVTAADTTQLTAKQSQLPLHPVSSTFLLKAFDKYLTLDLFLPGVFC